MGRCVCPLSAWQTESGAIVFAERGNIRRSLTLPCGQCIECRLERSRQWGVRIMHEASLHDANSFVTLTYNDENLPHDGGLVYRHFQLFMHRLRKRVPSKIRFFMCGEYGENFGRPHFHACIFGLDFVDKTLWQVRNGVKLYRSKKLESLWEFGYSSIGTVTFESAAYVARYIMKKVTGDAAETHYSFRSFNRGNLTAPKGIHPYVSKARHCKKLAPNLHV